MNLTILLIFLGLYLHLGWCWADVHCRLNPLVRHFWRSYLFSLLFWPLSMMIWDARQQEESDDNQY